MAPDTQAADAGSIADVCPIASCSHQALHTAPCNNCTAFLLHSSFLIGLLRSQIALDVALAS